MKITLLSVALLTCCTTGAWADVLLYDNTTTDTLDTVLYSVGPYIALGDQIELSSSGIANQAQVQLFNAGDAGTFDAELDLYNIGSPVGSLLGTSTLAGISSTGSDVINLVFDLAGIAVSQDLIFLVTINNADPNLDLGVDMFEPPTVGSSDNLYMIVGTTGPVFSQIDTNSENVYFQLSGTPTVASAAPEMPDQILLVAGLLALGLLYKPLAIMRRSI
jgi:hypothetical protein